MLYKLNLHDFFLVGFMQLFIASALLLSPLRRIGGYQRFSGSRISEVFLSAISAVAIAVVSCAFVSAIWGIHLGNLEVPGAVILCSVSVMVLRPDCNAVGQLFSAAFFAAGVGLILYTIDLSSYYANSGFELLASGFLILLSIGAVVLWNWYVTATTDVLCRFRHSRPLPQADPCYLPFVSIHIASYNEPPDMLIRTIQHAEAMDYPNFEIVVVDNNTKDAAVWRPVEEYCRGRERIKYVHVDPWPGFKAGALNLVLRSHTDERAEIIGLIDADDYVVPHYLKETVPYFADERIGFLQTFEGNRDFEGSPYYQACVDSYQAFYLTNMSSRNERDSVPFVGTMGLFRRSALQQIGGWNEWCICEDTEASVRVLKLGWSGLYIPRCFGRGMVPPSITGLNTQRYRWCFGGMQILRLHWRSFMPWDRSSDNRLSSKQRRDFLMASLGWTRDLLMVFFSLALFVTTGLIAVGSKFYIQPISGDDPILAMSLILVASLSMLWVFRQWTTMSRRRAMLSLVISLASSWTIAIACVQGIFRREGVFLRTPKLDKHHRVVHKLRSALWVTRWEIALVIALLACAGVLVAQPTIHWLLVVVVVFQAAVLFCAPLAAVWSVRAQVVPAAERVRRHEMERSRRVLRGHRQFVGGAVAAVMVALLGGLATASFAAPDGLMAAVAAPQTTAQVDKPPADAPRLAVPYIDLTGVPGGGWFEVTDQGEVQAGGGANFFGDLLHMPGGANAVDVENIVQIQPTRDGFGYWLVASDGSVYPFGDAPNYGSLPALGYHAGNIVGLVPYATGKGYELVTAHHGLWKFGKGKP